MMSNSSSLAGLAIQHDAGKIVSRGLLPGYVVLSFLISYIGSWTTLELINRRTSSRGFYNWSLLVGAAISMGGIGIWCMHFIGNRAIVLGDGSTELQIAYGAGLTAVSFFLPVLVVFMAFAAVGANEEISFVRLGLGGTLAGLGVCGMHYLGQASVTNYDCIYYVSFVIGAAIIAIVAATAALGIFFVFRAAWNAAWWKRAICAILLAGAVSGMHWLASVGTQYRLKKGAVATTNNSRNATTITVIVLSIGGCLILFVSTLLAQAQKARSAKKAKQVTLTTAVFDQDGRLMVKADGLLPTKKITDAYREKNFNDVFGVSHPTFLWIYRATRNWPGILDLVPAMREHLHRTNLRGRYGIESDDKLANDEGTSVADYSIIFRELFCAAAAELADDMGIQMDKLGILYDEIVFTGRKPFKGSKDLELGAQDPLGKGQLLFLVRVVDKAESQHLQSAGFRFATTANVIGSIAGILQIPRNDMIRQLDIMREFARDLPILDPGCHLGLFAVRASMANGFDILARKDARNQLPTMQLPFDTWEDWQTDYLNRMDTKSVAICMKQLHKASRAAATPPKEKKFAEQILHTLEALKDEIEDPFFNDAMLVAKPIEAPCRGLTENSPPAIATIIVFRLIIPIQSRAPGKKLDFTPLVFFKMQQHLYKNSRDHAVFARRAYREFAPVINLSGRPSIAAVGGKEQHHIDAEHRAMTSMLAPPKTPRGRSLRGYFRRGSRQETRIAKDNSSEKYLFEVQSEDHGMGGIMVSQEVSIDVVNRPASPSISDGRKNPGIELANMRKGSKTGVVSEVSKEEETPSYVDELFKIAIETRNIH